MHSVWVFSSHRMSSLLCWKGHFILIFCPPPIAFAPPMVWLPSSPPPPPELEPSQGMLPIVPWDKSIAWNPSDMPQTKLQTSLLPAITSSSLPRYVFSSVVNSSKDIFSRFNNIDLLQIMLADCCVPQWWEWGTVAAVGRRWPPWSGCVFYLAFT